MTGVGAMILACSDAQFGSPNASRASTSTSSSSEVDPNDPDKNKKKNDDPDDPNKNKDPKPTSNECENGSKVNAAYSGPVKECIDQGKLWNFDRKECGTAMKQASFACNFETFFQRLSALGLSPSSLLQQGAQGINGDGKPQKALLLGCGESDDKNTILIQWFFVPDGKTGCDYESTGGMIITGCYGENSGPASVSDEEKKNIVANCLNGVANPK